MKRIEHAAPWIGLAVGAAAAASAIYAFRRKARFPYAQEEEPGTFVYSYPLDLEEEIGERDKEEFTESALLDEEMFPGHQP